MFLSTVDRRNPHPVDDHQALQTLVCRVGDDERALTIKREPARGEKLTGVTASVGKLTIELLYSLRGVQLDELSVLPHAWQVCSGAPAAPRSRSVIRALPVPDSRGTPDTAAPCLGS